MKIKKLETRQPWLCEVDGTTYVRNEIQWVHDRPNDITWHLNEDQVEGKVYLTDEQLEKLFWENLDLPPDNYLIEQAREEPKQEKDYTALLQPVGTKQTAVEWLESEMLKPNLSMKDIFEHAKEMENQQKGYSEEEVYSIIRMCLGMKESGKTDIEIMEQFEQFKNK